MVRTLRKKTSSVSKRGYTSKGFAVGSHRVDGHPSFTELMRRIGSDRSDPEADVLRVLVADDRSVLNEALALMLGRSGMRVKLVVNAKRVVDVARRFRPHVIVLDDHMVDKEFSHSDLIALLGEAVPEANVVLSTEHKRERAPKSGVRTRTKTDEKPDGVFSVAPKYSMKNGSVLEKSVLEAAGR